MARPSPKKKRASTRGRRTRARGPILALAYGLFCVLVGGILFVRLMDGRSELARPGERVPGRTFEEDVREAIVMALRSEGLEPGGARELSGRASPVLRASLPGDASMTRANLGVTEAVARLGGEVIGASKVDGGVDLRVGHEGDEVLRLELRLSGTVEPAAEGELPRVAIIIDDLGHNRGEVISEMLGLEPGLTFAILPDRPHSRFLARRCAELGREVMLHLPMEPSGYPEADPGAGAILVEMQTADIRSRVSTGLSGVPGAVGVNNHMGSRATRDRRVMGAVMDEISAHAGLYFVDSVTDPGSVAWETARARGIPSAASSVFLDPVDDEREIAQMLERLERVARKRGSAIGIGHPRRNTLRVLASRLSEMEGTAWTLVPASDVIREKEST